MDDQAMSKFRISPYGVRYWQVEESRMIWEEVPWTLGLREREVEDWEWTGKLYDTEADAEKAIREEIAWRDLAENNRLIAQRRRRESPPREYPGPATPTLDALVARVEELERKINGSAAEKSEHEERTGSGEG